MTCTLNFDVVVIYTDTSGEFSTRTFALSSDDWRKRRSLTWKNKSTVMPCQAKLHIGDTEIFAFRGARGDGAHMLKTWLSSDHPTGAVIRMAVEEGVVTRVTIQSDQACTTSQPHMWYPNIPYSGASQVSPGVIGRIPVSELDIHKARPCFGIPIHNDIMLGFNWLCNAEVSPSEGESKNSPNSEVGCDSGDQSNAAPDTPLRYPVPGACNDKYVDTPAAVDPLTADQIIELADLVRPTCGDVIYNDFLQFCQTKKGRAKFMDFYYSSRNPVDMVIAFVTFCRENSLNYLDTEWTTDELVAALNDLPADIASDYMQFYTQTTGDGKTVFSSEFNKCSTYPTAESAITAFVDFYRVQQSPQNQTDNQSAMDKCGFASNYLFDNDDNVVESLKRLPEDVVNDYRWLRRTHGCDQFYNEFYNNPKYPTVSEAIIAYVTAHRVTPPEDNGDLTSDTSDTKDHN